MTEMKEGDIFRWRYKDPKRDGAPYAYHCRSRIAIVDGKWLRDTYWHGSSDNNAIWGFADASDKLDLQFVANFDDLEKRPEWHAAYYADADCVNLNHSNSGSGGFYVRKGAGRCRDKMLETVRCKLKRAEDDACFAESRAESARQVIASIESGTPLDEIYL